MSFNRKHIYLNYSLLIVCFSLSSRPFKVPSALRQSIISSAVLTTPLMLLRLLQKEIKTFHFVFLQVIKCEIMDSIFCGLSAN
jgi:hypothetical protein